MSKRPAFWLSGALAALALGACTEPVDCAAQPERCPRIANVPQLAPVAVTRQSEVAQPVAAAPTAAPALANRPQPLPVIPPAGAGQGGQRNLEIDQEHALAAARNARRAPGTLDAQTAADRMIILAIHKAAAARDFAALKPHMSDRLIGAIEPMLDQQGERFWKHLARYAEAAEKGFTVRDEAGDGSNLRHMIVTLPGGEELKPILTKTPDGWKFDRF